MTIPTQDQVEFRAGAPLEPGSAYVIVHADGTSLPDAEASPRGRGGAGIVYRARYKNLLDRAIKLLSPREDVKKIVETDQFLTTFDAEISILSDITHTRLSKSLTSAILSTRAAARYRTT